MKIKLFLVGAVLAAVAVSSAVAAPPADKGKPRIDSSDLYESLAFLDGAEAETIILVYPRLGSMPQAPCGQTDVFETVQRKDGRTVTAVMAECRGISSIGGFASFASGLATGVLVAAGAVATAAA